MMNISSATRCEPGYLNSNCLTSLALFLSSGDGRAWEIRFVNARLMWRKPKPSTAHPQSGKNREINAVLGKALRVLGHAQLFEPIGDLMPGAKPTRPSLR